MDQMYCWGFVCGMIAGLAVAAVIVAFIDNKQKIKIGDLVVYCDFTAKRGIAI